MIIKEIKEILQLMKEYGLSEVEIEKDGLKLKLKKDAAGMTYVEGSGESPTMVIPIPKSGLPVAAEAVSKTIPVPEPLNIELVKSPMVGTFYAAPAPDQPPYVSLGQAVKMGDVLCIIEAMKLMNEIKCEIGGTISDVLVKNGQTVEFDQPLFKIRKS